MAGLNPVLRNVLINGEFYKKENKLEYTENYNELIKLDDVIKRFDDALSPKGDWGKRYARTRKEISALTAKRRKLQIIQEEINEQADAVIEGSGIAMNGMARILNGITDKEPEGKYDTLSNLSQFNGKDAEFTEALRNAALKLDEGAKILKNIVQLETGK
jgi:hypothetical protein